jgi:predicted dehydrogenase
VCGLLAAVDSMDFAAVRDEIPGRAVLVRHEFAFTTAHTHRRRKYEWARDAGAGAFLIANNLPGCGVVSGSSGSGAADPMAVGFDGHTIHIEDMVRAIREDREPIIAGTDARHAVEICVAIQESAKSGREVKVGGR